jgi:predicted O-methyltransferase YrrM
MKPSLMPACPDWVTTGTIPINQAEVVIELLDQMAACNLVEIGTASGYSAALFGLALNSSGREWTLDTIDYGERCYFDPSRLVGECIHELASQLPQIKIHRSKTSLDIPDFIGKKEFDFAYIDGSHSSPWAAIDLIGLLPKLSDNSVVCLDDIALPFQPGYSHQNAARDLFRAWRGPKWIDQRAPNLGILKISSKAQAAGDAASVLLTDWDEGLSDQTIDGITRLLTQIEHLKYRCKEELNIALSRSSVLLENSNDYQTVSRYPLANSSILHPNSDTPNPKITWKGIGGSDQDRLQLQACCFNPSPLNPGAELAIRVIGAGQCVMSSTSMTLPPRTNTYSERIMIPTTPFDLEIEVLKNPERSADFSGIMLQKFIIT